MCHRRTGWMGSLLIAGSLGACSEPAADVFDGASGAGTDTAGTNSSSEGGLASSTGGSPATRIPDGSSGTGDAASAGSGGADPADPTHAGGNSPIGNAAGNPRSGAQAEQSTTGGNGTAGSTAAGGSAVGGTGASGAAGGDAPGAPSEGTCPGLPALSDYAAKGPFDVKVIPNAGPDASYYLFRPDATLGKNGFKHPVAVWGNGISTTPDQYQTLLSHIASHGIVAWIRLWACDDANAKKYFYGPECILCKSPWKAQSKPAGAFP